MNETNHAKLTNSFIDMNFNLSETALNLLAAILQRAYLTEQVTESGAPIVYIERAKLVQVGGIEKNAGRLRLYLEELQTALFAFECDEIAISCPLLCGVQYNPQTHFLGLEISRLFWPYISDFVRNYTKFSIAELWQIKGRHAKRFYLDVMRWSNTGTMKLSLDNLRSRYDTDYQYNDVQRRIIEPGIEQIHRVSNVRIHQTEHTRQGKKVITLNFIIRKPGIEVLQPLAEKLTTRYHIEKGFAAKIVNTLSPKDVAAVCDIIDANRAKMKVQNIGGYASTIFRNYGLKDNAAARTA